LLHHGGGRGAVECGINFYAVEYLGVEGEVFLRLSVFWVEGPKPVCV